MSGRDVQIGRVTAVNPGRRELRVRVERGRKIEFEEMTWVSLRLPDGETTRCKVVRSRVGDEVTILELAAGVPRDKVAKARGSIVIALAEDLKSDEPAGDDFAEVEGFAVVKGDGLCIGHVTAVFETLAHPVLEIEKPGGGHILLPAVPEVIEELDWDGKKLVVGDLAPFAVDDDEDDLPRSV